MTIEQEESRMITSPRTTIHKYIKSFSFLASRSSFVFLFEQFRRLRYGRLTGFLLLCCQLIRYIVGRRRRLALHVSRFGEGKRMGQANCVTRQLYIPDTSNQSRPVINQLQCVLREERAGWKWEGLFIKTIETKDPPSTQQHRPLSLVRQKDQSISLYRLSFHNTT